MYGLYPTADKTGTDRDHAATVPPEGPGDLNAGQSRAYQDKKDLKNPQMVTCLIGHFLWRPGRLHDHLDLAGLDLI